MIIEWIKDKLFNSVIFYKGKNFNIVYYGVFYALAFLFVIQLFFSYWYRLGNVITKDFLIYMVLIVPIFMVLFSKLLYLGYNTKRLLNNPLQVLNETGYGFFGAFIGLAISAFVIQKSILPGQGIQMIDIIFLFLPLGMIFMRIGCATYGCCYGHPYNGPLAVKYSNPLSKPNRSGKIKNISVHPSQLYAILKNVFIFVLIWTIFNKFTYVAVPTALWLMFYGVLRFFTDFTRFIQYPYFLGLRPTQIFSVIMFIIGVVLLNHITLQPYKFVHSFYESVIYSLQFIPYSLIGFFIFLFSFGFHSKKLGLYIS